MAIANVLGFPRIGTRRELKRALEGFWAGRVTEEQLQQTAATLRAENWRRQQEAGIDLIPCNDFSLYDHVLDTAVIAGAIPKRYGWTGGPVPLQTYFAMARGHEGDDGGIPAMEMTKWFDTNYHYIVPELTKDQRFALSDDKPVREFKEALALGIKTKPVLLGPISFLLLSKPWGESFDTISLLDGLLPVYETLLQRLEEAGAKWVQIDEPYLGLDLTTHQLAAYEGAFRRLAYAAPTLRLLVATYFSELDDNLASALRLPVAALHLELIGEERRGQLQQALDIGVPDTLSLSLGVVDGHNIWKTDWKAALELLEKARDVLGPERIIVSTSCSLLHVPIDLTLETKLDAELRNWIAFAQQKLEEIDALTKALNEGREAIADALAANEQAITSRRESTRIHRPEVAERLAHVTEKHTRRKSSYAERAPKQRERLNLPLLPTTTIGSFPQTTDVRKARAQYRKGELSKEDYEAFLRERIADAVRRQEEIGVDVLVHGEFERNDMVEYFGELLDGFAFTQHGWVQSYGSRYVKPPIIYGDVSRPGPMTVQWSRYAKSLTDKPVKGMLTGPVTILEWSFVRDDQPRETTCRQIALALRDEVLDLEAAGIAAIQIDEPALREGLPLRRAKWGDYLRWAVECFRLATSGVADETQIHTHMCYSEFNDIIEAVAQLDADVISIEASRSNMDLLDAFVDFKYPNEIGPGIWDIHSPRVPTVEEQANYLRKALKVLPAERLWVNPDCGLKTRDWKEVTASLKNLVAAAKLVREEANRQVG